MGLLAAMLSAVCPGLGQLYNGETMIGFPLMLIFSVSLALTLWQGFSWSQVFTLTGLGIMLLYVAGVVEAYLVNTTEW